VFWKYNIFGIIWLGLISYLSNKRVSGLPKIWFLKFEGSDKVVHLIFYFVAAFLFSYGFSKQRTYPKLMLKPFTAAFLLCLFWGILMELLQLTVFTYRSAELADIVANTMGAALGVGLFIFADKNFSL
jgi:VanZ family protein